MHCCNIWQFAGYIANYALLCDVDSEVILSNWLCVLQKLCFSCSRQTCIGTVAPR